MQLVHVIPWGLQNKKNLVELRKEQGELLEGDEAVMRIDIVKELFNAHGHAIFLSNYPKNLISIYLAGAIAVAALHGQHKMQFKVQQRTMAAKASIISLSFIVLFSFSFCISIAFRNS